MDLDDAAIYPESFVPHAFRYISFAIIATERHTFMQYAHLTFCFSFSISDTNLIDGMNTSMPHHKPHSQTGSSLTFTFLMAWLTRTDRTADINGCMALLVQTPITPVATSAFLASIA